jgi:N-acetyl-gamma-glutamyl-phosphate reductase
VKLIDLSADFRLKDPKIYKKWYGENHTNKKLIKKSLYAISEFSRKSLPKYNIISCPGCYPTSIQLPLIPILQNNMINTNNIIIDSKSGYSGAGKNLNKKFNFTKIYESVNAYKVGFHKHMAEIDQELSKVSKNKIEVSFTPHLMPVFRGILSTIYLEAKKNINAKKIYSFLKEFHKNNFFVKVAKYNTPIGTGDVINTNFCKISVCSSRKKNQVIIVSAIDNLIKGASGQAVQNMNISFNIKETMGLL